MPTLIALNVLDIRFPTSLELDGSDAMNPDPDYSAAYVQLVTDDGPDGVSLAFTIGRGNEVVVAAIAALREHVVGYDVETLCDGLGEFYRRLNNDSQLRWLGPEKGVMQMAVGAVVNAAWDLASKCAGLPLWQFMSRMSPEELIDAVDWRYIGDAITQDEALELLKAAEPGRAGREATLLADGYPAYTTSPGWLGYTDEKMLRLAHEAVADGYTQIKLKVGGDLADDVRRMRLTREALGPDIRIAVDANQRWETAEAVAWMRELLPYDPYWIEEPTSPDDILAHAAIKKGLDGRCKVATGEHVQNRIIFKQMLLADAIDILQVDAARVAGVNENIAILLLAAKYGVPVCPHAGGVGLCEMVQHLSMFDFVALTGTTADRVIEYVDHLHEHFEVPTKIDRGHYVAPTAPGGGAQMTDAALHDFRFPDGPVWQRLKGQA